MNQMRPKPSLPGELSADLCHTLMEQGALHAALTMLTVMLREDPENRALLMLASDCYWDMQEVGKSLQILEALLARDLGDVPVLGRLGSRLMALGNKDGAAHAFRAALAVEPENVTLISALDLVAPLAAQTVDAERLLAVAADPGQEKAARRDALNTLGRIAERDGDPARAMALFLASKSVAPGTYDRQALTRKITGQQTHLSADMFEGAAQGGMRPVFITGVPRSGTSLIEAMLVRHGQVGSVGESVALGRAARKARGQAADDWAWCKTVTRPQLEAVRGQYLEEIAQALPQKNLVVLDKMPRNILDVGLAAMAMPEAQFIYMQRHPLDVGLSLLRNNLSGAANGFTRSPEDIAHYIRQCDAAAKDYAAKLGPRFRMQSYPALIDAPETQMREVLQFLELEWDAQVLTPEAGGHSIRTASALQVRAGLNRDGLARWRRYEAALAPMIAALGGWDWIHDWEATYSA